MKTAAVICELNPMHNGHALLFQTLKNEYGHDFIIAVMSGNYVQRGEPALFDKHSRTKAALLSGADAVIELPSLYALSSAGDFAAAGVRTVAALGAVDTLAFGVECSGSSGYDAGQVLEKLSSCSRLQDSVPGFDKMVSEALRNGLSYPAAFEKAYAASGVSQEDLSLMTSPNNILAVEYVKAAKELRLSAEMLPIMRKGDSYTALVPDDRSFTSATALRALLLNNEFLQAASYMPSECLSLSKNLLAGGHFVKPRAVSGLLSMELLRLKREGTDLTVFSDVSREISGRLGRLTEELLDFEELSLSLKTRQYTYTRIRRALMHILLGITADELNTAKENGYLSYLRILGFRKESAPLLSKIRRTSSLPLVTKPADHRELLRNEIYRDHLYSLMMSVPEENEYRRQIVKL